MRTTTRLLLATAALSALVLAPAGAFAADGMPDEMVDPAVAVAPTPVDPAPVAEDNDANVEGGDAVVAEAAGVAGAGAAPAARTPDATAASTTAPAPSGTGSLPFTGLADGQLLMLLLVGSVLVAGGLTSWSWARATADAA